MKRLWLRPSPALLCLLPGLALVPVLWVVVSGLHSGGLESWVGFLAAALQPSTDPHLIQSLRQGVQVTLATALVG